MEIKEKITKPSFLIVLSAVLSALPLTFDRLFFLSWVSFVPLFYVILKQGGEKLRFALARGFLLGFVYHLCIYYWFLWFYPLDFAGLTSGSSLAVVLLAWVGISAVHGALWCVPFIACHLVRKVSNSKPLVTAVAILGIIAAEKLPYLSELSFPWARISLGQYKATALIQGASLFGIDGVDMLILAVNGIITLGIMTRNKKRIASLSVALAVFVANLCFGAIRINTAQNGQALTVMTVQGSVEQNDKWSSDGDKICYEAYSALTKENITDEVELILWPESAVPKVYKSEKSLKQYKKLSKELDTPILAGVLLKNDGDHTNNAALIDKSGVVTSYAKRQLVPFGEYMPYEKALSKLFPNLTELNIIEDDYVSGDSTAIMDIKGGRLGSIICFESIYPALTRQSTLDGAEALVEVTNDSWLKDSPAMYQHLAHGVFRSVENGRYLVRSANSGVSAVIDSRGKVVSQLDANEKGVITDTVYLSDKLTLYTLTGDVAFPVCCAAVFGWVVILFIKKTKKVER